MEEYYLDKLLAHWIWPGFIILLLVYLASIATVIFVGLIYEVISNIKKWGKPFED